MEFITNILYGAMQIALATFFMALATLFCSAMFRIVVATWAFWVEVKRQNPNNLTLPTTDISENAETKYQVIREN